MLKKWLSCICAAILLLGLGGCEDNSRKVKIGVSIGAGGAARWQKDMAFMQERAKALGADIELRLNLPDSSKTQAEDCLEMLSDGIDVLIITPNNTRKVDDVLMYAKQKNTKVVSYARAVMGGSVDLFVGYDCYKIGQNMGQHLTEKVYHGDIIVLKGDVNDFNTPFLYYGAMKYIKPLIENGKLNMVLDAYVPKWSPAEAKKLVKEAVAANGNRIDAIFASNDRLAGAAAEALEELHVTNHAVITGMDAELAAIKRILAGTQDATIYMDLRELAYAAVDEAYNLATKKKVNVNSELGNDGSNKINAFLINGKVVTRENINKVLIEPGHFTKEDIYSGKKRLPVRCAYPEPSFLFCTRAETLVGLFLRAPIKGAGPGANPPLSHMFPSAYSPIRFRQEAGMPPANGLPPLTACRHGFHALLPRALGRIVSIP